MAAANGSDAGVFKKLVGYAVKMFLANTATGLITFLVNMYGARARSKAVVGDYNTYMLIYGVIQTLGISGTNAAIQRYSAVSDENRARFGALSFYAFVALTVGLGVVGVGVGLAYDWSIAFAFWGAPWVILWWYGRYIVRSRLEASREARLIAAASLSNSICTLLFLTLTDLDDAMIYGDFAALVISGCAAAYGIPRVIGVPIREIFRTRVDRAFLKEIYVFSRPLWLAGQLFGASEYVSGFATRGLLGAAEMGARGTMLNFWQFAQRPMQVLSEAALPGLVKEQEQRSALYLEIQRLCLVAFPFVGIAVAAGSPLLLDVLGLREKYAAVPALLMVMTASVPFLAYQMVLNQYAIAEGRSNLSLKAKVGQVVTVGVIIYPLTRAFGLYGVITAGNLSGAVNAMVYAIALWKTHRREMRSGLTWTLLTTVFTSVCLIPSYVYREWRWSWTLSFAECAAFTAMLAIFGMINRADFARAARALKSLRPRSTSPA